jgi:sulfur carrier protein
VSILAFGIEGNPNLCSQSSPQNMMLTANNDSDRQPMIALQINGEERQCHPDRNMVELLEFLNMNPRLVAVEHNGEILHRQLWQETVIKAGDRLEIVTIVGGG